MSKIVVYILDKIVWLLLFTIIATQSLQIAGVMEAPKSLNEISYPQQSEYDYQLSIVNNEGRGKRQADIGEERSQFIDSLFSKQFGQGEYFFRIDNTRVIASKI